MLTFHFDSIFLNTEVWENCTNLEANVYYCVEPVGSISTYPGYGATTTATSTFVPTNCTSLPYRDILAKYTTTEPFIPFANGTRKDCYAYGPQMPFLFFHKHRETLSLMLPGLM